MAREWCRKPLKSLKMDSDLPACGWTRDDRNAAGPAETQRLEQGHQRAGSEYNLERELRRGKLIFI
jgi:hypothetical protein